MNIGISNKIRILVNPKDTDAILKVKNLRGIQRKHIKNIFSIKLRFFSLETSLLK
jgi:hypothetical protein